MNGSGKCPNAKGCQVLHVQNFVETVELKHFYFDTFCNIDTENGYFRCKRFQTKNKLGFCPEFVLPDSIMTLDEIMAKCEE